MPTRHRSKGNSMRFSPLARLVSIWWACQKGTKTILAKNQPLFCSKRTDLLCFVIGRSDRIRTCGLLVPNQAHYQTVPHPGNLFLNFLKELVRLVRVSSATMWWFCVAFVNSPLPVYYDIISQHCVFVNLFFENTLIYMERKLSKNEKNDTKMGIEPILSPIPFQKLLFIIFQ